MRPILFHLGDIAVPSFWAMSFLGFLAALLVVRRDMLERGMPERQAYDMILWGYIGGWVGARLFVIPTGWQYFVEAPVAFLLSGEMAFAYFLKHAPRDFWPIVNRGEVPVLLCFVFLYFAFAGGGAWSLDALLGRSHVSREPRPAHGPPRDHGAKRAA